MPIPSQPTTNISLGPTLTPTNRSIVGEFAGDGSPHAISEFRRGGPLVADHPINANIPTSGAVSFSQYNGGSLVLRHVITSSMQNLNLFDYASSPQRPASQDIINGYDQNKRYTAFQPGFGVDFVINPGVIIGSATRTQTALVTGTNGPTGWHPTVQIRVINNGTILGAGGGGGQGGAGGPLSVIATQAGQSGGTAFDAQRSVAINNASGTIAGGGGGGGGGGGTIAPGSPPKVIDPFVGGGGGGGAGQTAGTGGTAVQGPFTNPGGQPSTGQNGTPTTGGTGGAGEPGVGGFGNSGGAGGGRGQTGTAGGGAPGNPGTLPGTGGAAGYYILNNGNVTWIANGTQQGQPG
jgi:hypothetical protein